ncbi:spore coat protein [Candidatus Collierbacteria bacterium CG10_big_fil_rev_8_21_14_0_10_44_9]|uniref:glucose-1-phosphate thymidylyltransferase n=1 Tax=Candidatus Collierbacteria bacterium CG10_big_fil_rev_8_21_14_0_10_44_9 TaxID=1974535 RepID=A0A2H0VJI9_9BACT|nr:MAG: spore coat protein [Candidatus Collierbacteria bacterium CG10_big_fil_rev_8_21_14_0_10_44_9]
MKGVILAGGKGSRLYPLTYATNKHLLPIYNQPMIYYPIQTLVKAGITEILIVTGDIHSGQFINVIKNGKELGLTHVEYAYQEGGSVGIADALRYAEDFADGQSIAVILGDNTTDANISEAVKKFEDNVDGSMLFLKKVIDPERFGNPIFDPKNDSKIIEIIEKPKTPHSPYAVTGLYLYDSKVYDIIRSLKPSARGELEITDVNNAYIKIGKMYWRELKGFWSDAGTFHSLFRSNRYWAQKKLGIKYKSIVAGNAVPEPKK